MKKLLSAILFSAVFLAFPVVSGSSVNAAPCDAPITNPIPCENSKPGNPSSEWDIAGAGNSNIQGFATNISVNKGSLIQFKINTSSNNYRLDIYRIGYYGGLGARKITTLSPSATLPQSQPACLTQSTTGLIDCGNWSVSASWAVPADAVSGVYIAKLVRQDPTAGSSHIIFIVRDDTSNSDLLFQTSDTAWQAYNSYGGNSLYYGGPGTNPSRAYKVSYNRPFNTRASEWPTGSTSTWFFTSEYPMVRFLEANGYNVSYFTGVDSARNGSLIRNHKVFMSVGHDEYWSGDQRANVEAARGAGVNLAFFAGNEVFWKTRWENSIDGTNTQNRTLVSYKETHANAKIDPSPLWTGTWRDPRFSPPADGGRPENSLMGLLFWVNGPRNDAMTFTSPYAKLRFWRNTAVANLTGTQSITTPSRTLGYEWDVSPDNGFQPTGLLKMSSTTMDVSGSYLLDFGTNYGSGIATHNLTLYKHPSGSRVFAAGTINWSWGLDGVHEGGVVPTDPNMRQSTVNLFADMGVQPASLQSGLVAATASTDATAPSSTITFPTNNSTVSGNINITGTSSDTGGVVGGVEVSVDNGVTWHPASGTNNWTYNWTAPSTGSVTIKSRAIDDSANIQNPVSSVTVSTSTGPTPPPGTATITFNDLTNPDRNLTGTYAGVDWGSTSWYLSAPWRALTTNSFSFRTDPSQTGIFNFLSPRRIISIEAFNGGTAASTVSMFCAGNPNVSRAVNPNQLITILTNWTTACTSITLGSTNGWNTNFDNIVHDQGGPAPTPGSTPRVTPPPTPVLSPTPTPRVTATPVATPTSSPAAVTTVTFNDLVVSGWRYFNGQYPTGVINWGTTDQWTLSSPFGAFTTVNFSLPPAGGTRTMTFNNPKKVVRLDAYNGGSGSTTITLGCPGQANRVVSVATNTLVTIQTLWTLPCNTMTINSTNGWDSNFDNLVIQ